MSETVQLAFIAALPIILTQVVTAYLSYKGRQNQNSKLDVIHDQTNSNLTEQRALIKSLQDQVNLLLLEKGKEIGRQNQ